MTEIERQLAEIRRDLDRMDVSVKKLTGHIARIADAADALSRALVAVGRIDDAEVGSDLDGR